MIPSRKPKPPVLTVTKHVEPTYQSRRTPQKPVEKPLDSFETMIKSMVTDWKLSSEVDDALERFMDLADEYSGGDDNELNIKAFNVAMKDIESHTKLRIQDRLVQQGILVIPEQTYQDKLGDRWSPRNLGRKESVEVRPDSMLITDAM